MRLKTPARLFLALATLAGAGAASAENDVWVSCYFDAKGSYEQPPAFIVLQPFRVAGTKRGTLDKTHDVAEAAEKAAAIEKAAPGYHHNPNSQHLCGEWNDRAGAQHAHDDWMNASGYGFVRSLDFTPPASLTGVGAATGHAVKAPQPVASAPKKPTQPVTRPAAISASGAYITIEDRKPTGPTPEQLAAQAQAQRQADAARAAERARAAAIAAQADAKWKAMLELERERRRKCPRCQ